MSLFHNPSMKFLALFNDIDKKFDDVLGHEKYIPFNEKLKNIAQSSTIVSSIVANNHGTLKHLGEIRNQITHGLKINGEHLISPTSFAIKTVKKLRQMIVYPHNASVFLSDSLIKLTYTDLFHKALSLLKKQSHIPVYDGEQKLLGFFSHRVIEKWLYLKMPDKPDIGRELRTIPLQSLYDEVASEKYLMVDASVSLFDIFRLRQSSRKNRSFIVVQSKTHPDQCNGIITADDLPKIAQLIFG